MNPVSIPARPDPDEVDVIFDREQAFLLYATFCGDVIKTAAALNIRAAELLRMVDEEGWAGRLATIIELKKSNRPGDIERAVNRALNFVQAHRLRMFVERVIHKLEGMSADEMAEYMFHDHGSKDGQQFKRLNTRAVADLASAMEKAHALSYMALNDSTGERVKRKEGGEEGVSAGDMHARIAAAMSEANVSDTPRAQLFDAQVSTGSRKTAELARVPNPADNDDH